MAGRNSSFTINPATLQALRPGELIEIDVPREAREMRPSHLQYYAGQRKTAGRGPRRGIVAPGDGADCACHARDCRLRPRRPTPPFYVPPGREPVSSPAAFVLPAEVNRGTLSGRC